jgi:hypothetical protein
MVAMVAAKDCFGLFHVRKSQLLYENALINHLSQCADLTFPEIEAKVNSSLVDFCLGVARADNHCFEVGTAFQPGIYPSLWALWDQNGDGKINATELEMGQKNMDLDSDTQSSFLEMSAFLMRN